jgi:hypothetical protein
MAVMRIPFTAVPYVAFIDRHRYQKDNRILNTTLHNVTAYELDSFYYCAAIPRMTRNARELEQV